jgi:hypothetical protein
MSPTGLVALERFIKNDDGILRFFTTRVTTSTEKFNSRSFKNPYLDVKYVKKD